MTAAVTYDLGAYLDHLLVDVVERRAKEAVEGRITHYALRITGASTPTAPSP